MKLFSWLSAFVLLLNMAAQTSAAPKPATKKSNQARVSAKEVQELRDALAAQQKRVEEQRQQFDQLKAQLQQLLDATQQANAATQRCGAVLSRRRRQPRRPSSQRRKRNGQPTRQQLT